MCRLCTVAYSSAGVVMTLSSGVLPAVHMASTAKDEAGLVSSIVQLDSVPTMLQSVKAPTIKEPKWLTDQKAAERAAAAAAGMRAVAAGQKITVTYNVSTKGAITASVTEFKQQANQTLNDARGWARMGVVFQEVASGGQFTLVLSEASQLPSFSSGCDAQYSCRAGRYVIINQDRWLGATSSWNTAGGTLRDYRHMVINHETGHWLGHGHQSCGGTGQAAPVMQQQSINLQGCTFNAWPLASELWSTQLGITRV